MTVRILTGDCRTTLATLDAGSVQTCVTSPPYFGLRDYGHAGQIGQEPTPDAYVAELVDVFRAVRRVLADDGTLWLNLGDAYANDGKWGGASGGKHVIAGQTGGEGYRLRRSTGLKAKDLIGIPWRVAFALQADGWWLRSDIIWHKPNPMPESVTDRPTKAHEYVFLLSKAERYYYDAAAVSEDGTNRAPGNVTHKGTAAYAAGDEHHRTKGGLLAVGARDTRNARSVWSIESTGNREREILCILGSGLTAADKWAAIRGMMEGYQSDVWRVATQPYSGAHFATMPPALAERCVKAGSRPGDTVLDPFGGAGTTGLVADRLGRHAVLCELNETYAALARERIAGDCPMFADVDGAA